MLRPQGALVGLQCVLVVGQRLPRAAQEFETCSETVGTSECVWMLRPFDTFKTLKRALKLAHGIGRAAQRFQTHGEIIGACQRVAMLGS